MMLGWSWISAVTWDCFVSTVQYLPTRIVGMGWVSLGIYRPNYLTECISTVDKCTRYYPHQDPNQPSICPTSKSRGPTERLSSKQTRRLRQKSALFPRLARTKSSSRSPPLPSTPQTGSVRVSALAARTTTDVPNRRFQETHQSGNDSWMRLCRNRRTGWTQPPRPRERRG